MSTSALIARRLIAAGVSVSESALAGLAAYLDLLVRWNRRINLTGFDLEPPSDAAIDRLVVEGVLAAPNAGANDRTQVDIGSGAGSPALPIQIVNPARSLRLVEVRQRKAAFLREVTRALKLPDVVVHCDRWEDVLPELSGVDVVSVRAVLMDRALWRAVGGVLGLGGRVLWFGGRVRDVPEEYEVGEPADSGLVVAVKR